MEEAYRPVGKWAVLPIMMQKIQINTLALEFYIRNGFFKICY